MFSGEVDPLKARNPLRILPYQKSQPAIELERNSEQVKIILAQKIDSCDIVQVTMTPKDQETKVVNFEARTGLDAQSNKQ